VNHQLRSVAYLPATPGWPGNIAHWFGKSYLLSQPSRSIRVIGLAMKFKSQLLSLLVLLLVSLTVTLLITSPVAAQTGEKEKAQKEAEKRQELERKTLALLDETVAAAWGFKLSENRSFVLTNAADLLWTRDEKRARSMFWEALNSLGLPTSPALDDATAKDSTAKGSTAKVATNDKVQAQSRYFATFAARRDFLRKVARRDPQLALDMLRATRQLPPPRTATYRWPDESDLEQEIANEAAERDPKRALQIARESLARGLTFELMNLLYRLNQQNQDAGTEFAGDLIGKLQTANLAIDAQAWWVAIDLLRSARTPQARPVETESKQGTLRPLRLSDDQRRELVEILTNAALSVSVKASLLNGLSEVMPEIELFAPDGLAKLKAKLAEINRTPNKNQQDWNTYNSLFENGTPEEMIKAAAKVGDETRDSLYREAIMKAVMTGKADALREFINNQIEDGSRRKSLIDSLDGEQIGAAAYQGKTEELQKLLPLIRLKEERARAMAELAILLEKKGEHEEAVKLLDDAQALVKVDLKSETQSNALMAFMLAYALVEPAKAFAIIEPIVDCANDDISKLLVLDKIVKSGAVKNGEILMPQPGIPLDFEMLKYGPGVVALANADFNRTKALADRFQRHELRIMARLLLAQSILRGLETSPTNAQQSNTQ
jgi:hypothetical protein